MSLLVTLPLWSQDLQRMDLKTALELARRYGGQIQSADIARQLAREDRKQALAAALPTVNAFNQFIYTQGNGTASGVFVANDGVHIYNEQLQAHEELLALARRGEIRLARAAEAVAKAKAEVAARGLNATVTQDYYTIAAAEEKLVNAQKSLDEAQQFLDITQRQEQGGEVAHADVIKAQLALAQRQRDGQDAQLAVDKAKTALAVLIQPSFTRTLEIVNDLAQLPPLPEMKETDAIPSADLQAAQAAFSQAHVATGVARYGYLPSLGLDVFYGINANQFADRTTYVAPENPLLPYRQNLGYSAQATLNVPVWNWGATHSKVKQAGLREEQAKLDLTAAQKQTQASLANALAEAKVALAQVESLKQSASLSAESLRLTVLRYKAGEATALEVVDAQTTASLSRNAYDDGLLRYRVALTAVQVLTGNF